MTDQQNSDDTARLREEIEATRHELGDTVAALGSKLDVKTRVREGAKEYVSEAKQKSTELVEGAKERTEQVVGTVKERGEQLVEGAKVKGQELVEGARQRKDELTEQVRRSPREAALIAVALVGAACALGYVVYRMISRKGEE